MYQTAIDILKIEKADPQQRRLAAARLLHDFHNLDRFTFDEVYRIPSRLDGQGQISELLATAGRILLGYFEWMEKKRVIIRRQQQRKQAAGEGDGKKKFSDFTFGHPAQSEENDSFMQAIDIDETMDRPPQEDDDLLSAQESSRAGRQHRPYSIGRVGRVPKEKKMKKRKSGKRPGRTRKSIEFFSTHDPDAPDFKPIEGLQEGHYRYVIWNHYSWMAQVELKSLGILFNKSGFRDPVEAQKYALRQTRKMLNITQIEYKL